METSYQPELRRLTLRFEDEGAVDEFVVGVESNAGFLVQLATALKLHDPVSVVLKTGEFLGSFEARVAQVFDKGFGSYGTALLVDDPAGLRERLEAGTESAEAGPMDPSAGAPAGPDGDPSDGASDPSTRPVKPPPPPAPGNQALGDVAPVAEGDDSTPSEGASEEPTTDDAASDEDAPEPVDEGSAGEMMGTSPIHRINAMNPRQRARLALKAGRTERQILLRDKSPLVLESLLNNPRIDSEEVLRIARSSRVVAPTLQRIANDSRWNANQEILAVIARHPKTPSVFATRLLPSLRTSDLRTMAKMSSGLREMVRKAALREYMQRTGQRI